MVEAPRRPVGRDLEITWLQPFPDALLGPSGVDALGMDAGGTADPAAVVAARDSIRLAFVAALQHLPARQRAVLILRDVLAWRAAEVADLLEITTTAVNSALQRARAQLQEMAPDRDRAARPADQRQRELADRYVAAFVDADITALTRLLADEVVLEMPPFLAWFRGRETVGAFLAARALAAPGRWRAIPVWANGQPAMGAYLRQDDGRHHAHSVQVFDVTDGSLTWIAAFQEPGLFATFGLPLIYPADLAERIWVRVARTIGRSRASVPDGPVPPGRFCAAGSARPVLRGGQAADALDAAGQDRRPGRMGDHDRAAPPDHEG